MQRDRAPDGAGGATGAEAVIVILAALIGQPATMCRNLGASVRCELAPARAIPVALTALPPPVIGPPPRIRKVRRHHHAAHPVTITDPKPSSAVAITAHIGSLVEIGDCTGARDYAGQAGSPELAAQTFANCTKTR